MTSGMSAAYSQPAAVGQAVGSVTEVWAKDDRFAAFHSELGSRIADIPSLEQFMQQEQWVTVLASDSLVKPLVVKARVRPGLKIQVGDVVRVRMADNSRVPSYSDMSELSEVVCPVSTASYRECQAKTEIGAWTADRTRITTPRN